MDLNESGTGDAVLPETMAVWLPLVTVRRIAASKLLGGGLPVAVMAAWLVSFQLSFEAMTLPFMSCTVTKGRPAYWAR
jgi:hypothetical protein